MTNHPSHINGMQNIRTEHLYKVLVIGDLGVGKTSIIRRYVHQTYSNNYRATIGVDFALKVLNWDSETVRLQLWDIAGLTVKDIFIIFYLLSARFHQYCHCISVSSTAVTQNLQNFTDKVKKLLFCNSVLVP